MNSAHVKRPPVRHRRRLHLFLEDHVMPVVSAKSIMNAYAEGPRQFRRDFRAQYDVPLERWLTWRRLDLARARLRHGRPVALEDVAIWVGYQNFQHFRQQFHARFGLWPEELRGRDDYQRLSQARQARVVTPFWHWGHPHGQLDSDAALAFVVHTQRKQYPRWEQRRLRRIEAQIRHEAIERAAARSNFVGQETPPVVPGSGEASPPAIDIAAFIKLESFLKAPTADLPLAA